MSLLPNWLTGYDPANAAAAQAADAQLQAMNKVDAAKYGDAWAAQVAQDYGTQVSFDPAVQTAQVDQAFTDSLASSANNLIGTPLGIFWAEIKALLKAVPWWVWIGLLVIPFFWLGGPAYLKAAIKKIKK